MSDNSMFYRALGDSIQANKDKIEKLEKQNTRLKKKNKELKEEIKGYQEMYFDKVMLINKAIEYIENDLQSFLYSIEYKTLLKILKGED